jgi:hypothetical protein
LDRKTLQPIPNSEYEFPAVPTPVTPKLVITRDLTTRILTTSLPDGKMDVRYFEGLNNSHFVFTATGGVPFQDTRIRLTGYHWVLDKKIPEDFFH